MFFFFRPPSSFPYAPLGFASSRRGLVFVAEGSVFCGLEQSPHCFPFIFSNGFVVPQIAFCCSSFPRHERRISVSLMICCPKYSVRFETPGIPPDRRRRLKVSDTLLVVSRPGSIEWTHLSSVFFSPLPLPLLIMNQPFSFPLAFCLSVCLCVCLALPSQCVRSSPFSRNPSLPPSSLYMSPSPISFPLWFPTPFCGFSHTAKVAPSMVTSQAVAAGERSVRQPNDL
jgi:hypothetical protein